MDKFYCYMIISKIHPKKPITTSQSMTTALLSLTLIVILLAIPVAIIGAVLYGGPTK